MINKHKLNVNKIIFVENLTIANKIPCNINQHKYNYWLFVILHSDSRFDI